ncbi:hypothetical protein KR067_002418 [Drosophila pandora]|nr:hypothetical protein KR067_002418 [Drosophila pandora]
MDLSLPKVLCICFIVSFFRFQKTACNLLSLYSVRYDAVAKRFSQGIQWLEYCFYAFNLFSLISILMFHIHSRLIYIVPFFYYVQHKKAMLKTLNEITEVHLELQSLLGRLFCVEVKRAVVCSFIVVFEILSVACWQLANFSYDETLFATGFLLFWLLQPLLQMNSYVWLLAVYMVMHKVLSAPKLTSRERWKMAKSLLKIHRKLGPIQRDVASYFSVYLMSVMVTLWEIYARILIFEAGISAEVNSLILMNLKFWQIKFLALTLLLIATLLFLMKDFKSQRDNFVKGLGSSGLLSQRIGDFRKRIVSRRRYKKTLDVVDLLLRTGNRPKDLLCPNIPIMELRIDDRTIFVSETPAFVNYLGLLVLIGFLIPFGAMSNGFHLSLDDSSQMAYSCDTTNCTRPQSVVLSRALGE